MVGFDQVKTTFRAKKKRLFRHIKVVVWFAKKIKVVNRSTLVLRPVRFLLLTICWDKGHKASISNVFQIVFGACYATCHQAHEQIKAPFAKCCLRHEERLFFGPREDGVVEKRSKFYVTSRATASTCRPSGCLVKQKAALYAHIFFENGLVVEQLLCAELLRQVHFGERPGRYLEHPLYYGLRLCVCVCVCVRMSVCVCVRVFQ